MKDFFIDTANIPYIENLWKEIGKSIDGKYLRGVTTNPNAFFKLNKVHLNEWLEELPKLCKLVSGIRSDDKGVVYVQCPDSNMSQDEVIEYAKLVVKYSDGQTRIGLKIPPFENILRIVHKLSKILEINVTGVSDCATALKCMTYPISYVSVIPGRMEEVGIDAKNQIAFINQSHKECDIITGSMRTIEGLKWVFEYDTIPTIGERVWDLLLKENRLDEIVNIQFKKWQTVKEFSPEINEKNYNLSYEFFQQMDKCGKEAYTDFIKTGLTLNHKLQ